jgi:hypothetical protein
VDVFGNIVIGDPDNDEVRRITPAGIISNVAGTGSPGYSGDGGLATAATLYLGTDMSGNVYIAEFGNAVIRSYNP